MTDSTAMRYGEIINALRAKGNPIPTNDIWIAAQAMEHNCELITYDQHYVHVDGLKLVLLATPG